MKHSNFRIGLEFMTATGRWRCTDVGTRTVVAIRLNHDDDPRWYEGPPYAIVEHVFDEDGIEDCRRATPRTSKRYRPDDSGKNDIVTVQR
jgi:hypothetical protein